MQRILVVGAGRSASTLIQYLLDHSEANDWQVIVADYDLSLAKQKIENHPNGTAIRFDVFDEEQRNDCIRNADIVVSMLPSNMHLIVAKDCLEFKKDLVTASYVSNGIKQFDSHAKKNNLIFLNEIGLDPGIDHMSAMKVIDELKLKGAKLKSFKSYCGGLIHPDSDNNPWNYKFTWNPRNVILAGKGTSKYLQLNKVQEISYKSLFTKLDYVNILNEGKFEAYANRDSLSYIASYGLNEIETMYRGTVRKVGFCNSWNTFVKLGLTNDDYVINNSEKLSYKDLLSLFLPSDSKLSIKERFCKFLSIDIQSDEFQKFEWLGIFSNKLCEIKDATPAQVLQKITEEKLSLSNEDKDMVVMQHQFDYILNNKEFKLNSSLVVYGDDQTNTAMAKTV